MQGEFDRLHGQDILGPALFNVPYDEVERVFASFAAPRKRGGFTRIGKTPIGNAHPLYAKDKLSPHYHVEMSFTEEQRGYVVTTLSLLGALANGKVFGNVDTSTPSFADQVEENYRRQVGKGRFYDALIQSSLDLLQEFRDRYGNLMPALNAIFQVAGAEGIETVMNDAANFGIIAEDNPDITEEALTVKTNDRNRFMTAHPWNLGPFDFELKYEVWCSGEALAKILSSQAAAAALRLVRNGNIAETTEPTLQGEIFSNPLAATLRNHVVKLAEDAAAQQVQG